MKRHWIEYRTRRQFSPLTYWVHRPTDGALWHKSKDFNPPMPLVAGRGYPRFLIEYGDFVYHYASLAELRHCIDVLSRRVLPTAIRLCEDRGDVHLNSHWLSRLPAHVLPAALHRLHAQSARGV